MSETIDRATFKALQDTTGAEFVIELAEFDRGKQYLDMGYRSLWEFCRRELGLSETQTHYRIAAARQVLQNPQLVDELREGHTHREVPTQ